MANTVSANDFLEVTIVQELAGQTLLNILHYRVGSGAAGAVDINTVADEIKTDFQGLAGLLTLLVEQTCSELTFKGLRIQKIAPTRQAYVYVPINEQGDLPDPALPPSVAISITKRTDEAGRDQHSDSHFSGLPMVSQSGGTWTNGTLTDWQPIANELRDFVPVPSLEDNLYPVILHKTPPPVVVITGTDITSALVQDTVRTLRRRQVRLGV